MLCSQCGKPIDANNRVCQSCVKLFQVAVPMKVGYQPTVKKSPKTSALIRRARSAVLTVIIALMAFIVLKGASVGASNGFDTPEATIEYFINCVRNEDYDGALKVCAGDEIAAKYDYTAMIKRLQVVLPTQYLPSEYKLYAAYNKRYMELSILRQLSWMTLSVILPPKYNTFLNMTPLQAKDIDIESVVNDMNPEKMKHIKIVEIGKSSLLDNDRHQRNLEQQAKIYGADKGTSRVVLYQIDSEYYVGGFHLLQYDGNWLIMTLYDVLINQTALGSLTKVNSQSEFRAMLKQ